MKNFGDILDIPEGVPVETSRKSPDILEIPAGKAPPAGYIALDTLVDTLGVNVILAANMAIAELVARLGGKHSIPYASPDDMSKYTESIKSLNEVALQFKFSQRPPSRKMGFGG